MKGSLKVEIYGESHSEEVGVRIYGVPTGLHIDTEELQRFTDRRKSANNEFSTPRRENDTVEITAGIADGTTDGGVICARVKNLNIKKSDYEKIKTVPRPSHADYCSYIKYGKIPSGGGRFSGRMTLPLCIAGGIAAQILKCAGIEVAAYVSEIGGVKGRTYLDGVPSLSEVRAAQRTGLSVPAEDGAKEAIRAVLRLAAAEGNSVGGAVECIIYGIPAGVGGALFDGLEGAIAQTVFAVPAVKGLEFGWGFLFASAKGSDANDGYGADAYGNIVQLSNNCGGIYGGISSGAPVLFRVAFKPTPSISLPQKSVDLVSHKDEELVIKGRHDCCIVPRASVCIEAAAALAVFGVLLAEKKL
ncbi:MAG: chorismate synthase [Clostridiaceae bacterium]|jgi:chorismate synthase|nr:chorismate synthase [Clostridiaceae bacterium]